jgi:hypothetical protein
MEEVARIACALDLNQPAVVLPVVVLNPPAVAGKEAHGRVVSAGAFET